MESYLIERGFETYLLTSEISTKKSQNKTLKSLPEHYHFLEYEWKDDARQVNQVLEKIKPDWLIVDHYGLDYRWENEVKDNIKKLFVIDDLADRKHISDLLLDQTLGRTKNDYKHLVKKNSEILAGSKYALLRSEFIKFRDVIIKNRDFSKVSSILITMGGVDKNNCTNKVLEVLNELDFPQEVKIKIIMGKSSPWIKDVKEMALDLTYKVEVLTNINNMAELMNESDLIIGASGSTAWERCCLGVPSINIVLEKNQEKIGEALHSKGASISVSISSRFYEDIRYAITDLFNSSSSREKMARLALEVTDGKGTNRVYKHLMQMAA